MFKDVDQKKPFPVMETEVLSYWTKEDVFGKSVEENKDKPAYVFYDGPPFATGLPHYGHFVPGILKDVIPRFWTMKGYQVERRWGWDCHGLPVEYEMEKELNLRTKKDIINFGIDRFNEACRSIVLRYTKEWERIMNRAGRWVDFANAYRTMDPQYMESIWWVFKSLWDKGLIYEGYKILPYCTRCATPLSNFEVNQGYQDVKDPAITVKFKSLNREGTWYLAWTTTPWTLPSNLALALGSNIDYVEIKDTANGERYILAEARLSALYKSEAEYEIVTRFKGCELDGEKYEPLFPYFATISDKAFRLVLADYVSTEDGTGIVHTAPGFGEDDYQTGQKYGLPVVAPVDENGEFTSEVSDYPGMHVKAADPLIIERLKKDKKLVRKETITHSYPHCWRCESPLVYKAISTWFVRIEPIKKSMLAANEKIAWVPDHIKEGRFGKWLEGARDWAISRNRFWGTPLPVWRCESCETTVCIGSIDELGKKTGAMPTDIHKHFVDKMHFACEKCGGTMTRIEEVLDCWFESGSMPYAQEHYPFENREKFESRFPAEFIAEGLDQTRGWFYTLTILAAALFDKPAFMNCVVNGMVLAEDGKKMSKRLKNYPEPTEVIDKYGADALRLYLINSAVVRGEELRFSETGVREIVKNVLLPLWNSYSFFVTYANIDGWTPPADIEKAVREAKFDNELDRWILSVLQSVIKTVTETTDEYKIYLSVKPLVDFIDNLTNWYIRRSRRRFWKSENDTDKNSAYLTLYYVLFTFVKTTAPFIPFISDEIYRNLKTEGMPDSVHLCRFPEPINDFLDRRLEKRMELIARAVNLGRSLRTQYNLKVRQPLSRVIVIDSDQAELDIISDLADLIKDELNVHDVEFSSDEARIMKLSAKPNFKKLGKVYGKDIGKAQAALLTLKTADIISLLGGNNVQAASGDFTMTVSLDDITVIRETEQDTVMLNEGKLTVAIDTHLTPELIKEGHARELVNKIQNMRKESGFEVTDRITVRIFADGEIGTVAREHDEYIRHETLSNSLTVGNLSEQAGIAGVQEWDINAHATWIAVTKV